MRPKFALYSHLVCCIQQYDLIQVSAAMHLSVKHVFILIVDEID